MQKLILGLLVATVAAASAYMFASSPLRAEEVMLYKNPQCGCCEEYADYLRQNGFTVTVKPTHDLAAMSTKAGMTDDFQGCHLAQIDNYVVSGHVPVSTINKLLTERPAIKGITLPGMPEGSPGMSGTKNQSFVIYEVGGTGSDKPKVYALD
jgi:hypothetical protein